MLLVKIGIIMKELKAKEGYYLTQSTEVGDERIYAKILKGASLNESDWREATQEEKETWDKEQEAKREAERNARLIPSIK